MRKTEHIYGVDCELPVEPLKADIAGSGLEKKKQKFYRTDIPDFFEDLEFDADENPIYNSEQLAFINQELDRIDNGYWFFNHGKATYITGLHYFYLNYWTLEDGSKPDYRACDRRWFYFQDACEKLPYVDGIIRTKKRREGATSQASASLMKDAITIRKAFCGILSKTGKDAESVFLDMIVPGYHELPVFLKPRCEDDEPKKKMVFNKKKNRALKKERKKGQLFDEARGLGSVIDWRNSKLNSYDSGRKTKILIDEGGKNEPEVPVNEQWPIIRQTLKQGARRVGFALMPSTSNKLTKGGKGFKILWDESNQFIDKKTATGLYRYFTPAEEGLVPFIDEYGESIIGKPTPEQARWMREYYGASEDECELGAAAWLDAEYEKIKDPGIKNEFKRMYPRNEKDAFDFENSQNIYPQDMVREQKDYLLTNPPKIRSVTFYRKKDGTADFIDDSNGMWKFLNAYMISPENANKTVEKRGHVCPANAASTVLTADPFKNTIVVGKGSKAGAFLWSKLNPLDPENTGLPFAMFWGRPKLKKNFHEQMLLAAEYFGAEICYESDYDDYIEYLMGQHKMGYAKERPKNTIDPNRKTKSNVKEYGVKSGDGFSYSQMIDRSVEYVILYCKKIFWYELLDQLEAYDESERTLFDLAVAFQLGAVAISDPVKPKNTEVKTQPVVRTYKLT